MSDEEDIPDDLLCPVCFNLPSKAVYQCKDGHVLCSKCYLQLQECPQCRRPLNKEEPIRNRHFEARLVGFQQVACVFNSNGCKERTQARLIKDHQKGCCFDIQKFGKFINLCKLMNYDCIFRLNNGNVEEAVAHFTSVHGAALTRNEKFTMEVKNFKDSETEDTLFWNPVIADLKQRNCYLLTTSVKTEDCFAFYSIYLPYPNLNGAANPSKTPFWVEYSVSDGHLYEPMKLSYLQVPVSLKMVAGEGEFNLPRMFSKSLLDSYGTRNLRINCIVRDAQERAESTLY